jgi:AcrR family transcriptional regulator
MSGKATPRRSRAAPRKPTGKAPPKRAQGRPQKQDPGITREGLIAITRDLLQTTPPAALTRAAIARAAGVDPGLIRYYFGDTAALLAATTEAAARELRQRQRALTAQGRSPEESLRDRIRVLVETLHEAPYLHRLLLEQIVYGRSDAVRGVREELVHGALREWEAMLAQGIAEGRMRRVDVRHLLLAVIGMCSFPMTERPLFQELTGAPLTKEAARAYAESVASFVLDGLRPAS